MKTKFATLLCITLALCIGLTSCGVTSGSKSSSSKYEVGELTSDEKDILISWYNNSEKMAEGKLFDYQVENLERYRLAKETLKQKYPHYDLQIKYSDPATGDTPYAKFTFEYTGDDYSIYVYDANDSSMYTEDNFYSYFIKDDCESYLFDLLSDNDVNVFEIEVKFPWGKDATYDENLTFKDILNGSKPIRLTAFIDVVAGTGDEFNDTLDKVEDIICGSPVNGAYSVKGYPEDYKISNELSGEDEYKYGGNFQHF